MSARLSSGLAVGLPVVLGLAAVLVMASPLPALAHVGSPDLFHEGMAGPYRLLVTIRPPMVVPGVAEIEVRSSDASVSEVDLVPMPMTGEGSKNAPRPDFTARSREDPQFFTGHVWLMASGSWQVLIAAKGSKGEGELRLPVPALAHRMLGMETALEVVLVLLMVFLVAGVVGIVGATTREATLPLGASPDAGSRRRARLVMGGTAILLLGILALGNAWWNAEASDYGERVYKPIGLEAAIESGTLHLDLKRSWFRSHLDDVVLDHGHPMHLFMVRFPEMDQVFHLHPVEVKAGSFAHALPTMAAGHYLLFADIVHRTGLAETATAALDVPDVAGAALTGDDASGAAPPLSRDGAARTSFPIEGGSVVWERPATIRAGVVDYLRFRVLDTSGQPARDLELYMGMQGHVAILAPDGSVFAHIHPSGSVPMGALDLLPNTEPCCPVTGELPSEIAFPYGFPKAGLYRVFLQFKERGEIRTVAFDVQVAS